MIACNGAPPAPCRKGVAAALIARLVCRTASPLVWRGMHGDGKGIHQDIAAGEPQLGKKALRLLP